MIRHATWHASKKQPGNGEPRTENRRRLQFPVRGSPLPGFFLPAWSVNNRQDVVLGHDQVLFLADLHLADGVRSEEDAIAFLHLELGSLAVVQQLAVAEADY